MNDEENLKKPEDPTKAEKPSCYVSQITFNNGKHVDIKQNDIVVFVGPNNAGKSQSLRDIHSLCENDINGTVISNIVIKKDGKPISEYLKSILEGINEGHYLHYKFMDNCNMYIHNNSDSSFTSDKKLGNFTNFFVASLDTSARLDICNPAGNIVRNQNYTHPIHYAAFNSEYRKWLSENFKKSFGAELIPNTLFGGQIPLCFGDSVNLTGEYTDEQERQEEYGSILSKYEQVQNQGDGIKSFTGILLYLMLHNYNTYLIDEPESFLHPPQANIMGRIIGETLSENQQAFISTHSEEIIKGLSSVCPDRLKIIRITRDKNKNSFSILDNANFKKLWSDPLLKYSNIMNSLFHKNVVLCESDSDCKMYSIIESHLKLKENKYSETLFIHCGGKHRMAKVASALLSLGIETKLVPDLDVFNDANVFKTIVETFGISWEDIEKDYDDIASTFNNTNNKFIRKKIKNQILGIIDAETTTNLSNAEIANIRNLFTTKSKWENLKKCGISAIPSGDASAAFERINEILKQHGIYVVPEGELENFVKNIGGHGPDWVNTVLEKYPDLDSKEYDSIKNFVRSLDLK